MENGHIRLESKRVPEYYVTEFEEIKEELNVENKIEVLYRLIDFYRNPMGKEVQSQITFESVLDTILLELSDSEALEVKEALEHVSLKSLLITGLLAESRRSNSQSEARSKLSDLSYSELANDKYKRLRGVALERLRRGFDAIVAHNNSCEDINDCIRITASVLHDLTGSNQKSTKEFMSLNQSEIELHNTSKGLSHSHNSRSTVNVKQIIGSIRNELERY